MPSAHVLKPVQAVDSAFSCVFFGHRGEGRNYVLWELGCIDTFFVRSVLLLYIVSTDLSKKRSNMKYMENLFAGYLISDSVWLPVELVSKI